MSEEESKADPLGLDQEVMVPRLQMLDRDIERFGLVVEFVKQISEVPVSVADGLATDAAAGDVVRKLLAYEWDQTRILMERIQVYLIRIGEDG